MNNKPSVLVVLRNIPAFFKLGYTVYRNVTRYNPVWATYKAIGLTVVGVWRNLFQ